jgi:hypothetical protein
MAHLAFYFFTASLLADVTHTQCGLGRYFLVSTVFTVPINSTGSRFNLLLPML